MVGTYHQFGAFVSGVASLPRVVIMTMHDISLRPVNADKDPAAAIRPNSSLELAGTVKTYRYLDEEETAAAAAASPDAKGGQCHAHVEQPRPRPARGRPGPRARRPRAQRPPWPGAGIEPRRMGRQRQGPACPAAPTAAGRASVRDVR